METTEKTTATVSDRTTESVVVEVTHAYWYRTEELESDGESEARHLVTVDDTRPIDGN